MKILLCPNGYTGEQAKQAVACFEALSRKHECALSPSDSQLLFHDESKINFSAAESDLVVSLGGDGSVLRAAQTAVQYDKPLIGINSGRLGYLSCIDFSEIEKFDELFPALNYSERMLFEIEYGKTSYVALNDIIIAKSNFGATVDLTVKVDSTDIGKVRGDGLIVATPTGSTAYNLSAGGPVLDYGISAMVLTPICSHLSTDHPIVLNDRRIVSVSERNDSADLFADGRFVGKIQGTVTIRKSGKTLKLYSTKGKVGRINLEKNQ